MFDELQFAINRERQWRKHMLTMDSGSYCENPSPTYVLCKRIANSYQVIADTLLAMERMGYTPAPFKEAAQAESE